MKKKIILFLSLVLPDSLYLKFMFFFKHNKILSLSNPETLNEKIQYSKLYEFEDFHTIVSDKYEVRNYVKERIGGEYLIPLLHYSEGLIYDDFNNLRESFVMKSNHGSSHVVIVKDIENYDKNKLVEIGNRWLKENHYQFTKERQYKSIPRKIIFEKLLSDKIGNVPEDYKFHCFNGKVEFIHVDSGRFVNHTRNFYDLDWNLLEFEWSPFKKGKARYPKGDLDKIPKKLDEMIFVAEKLSKPFKYVRIDLFNVGDRVYFGEITLHHGSGWEKFSPISYDKKYGSLL